MTPEFYFRTANLLVWRPKGKIDNAAIRRFLAFLESVEAEVREPFVRFNDLSRVTGSTLTYADVSEHAIRRRSHASSFLQQPVRVAFYAISPVTFGVARMFQNLLAESKTEVRVFQDLRIAAAWLGVDVALLKECREAEDGHVPDGGRPRAAAEGDEART